MIDGRPWPQGGTCAMKVAVSWVTINLSEICFTADLTRNEHHHFVQLRLRLVTASSSRNGLDP
jgi:hypothetical protein